jgi:aarF domain-containing kinase
VFLPFLLLAPALLVLAAALEAREKREGWGGSEEGGRRPAPTAAVHASATPSKATSRRARDLAWRLLLLSIRASGPAFIKWGQWSATREDMFPPELCEALSSLHGAAPRHGWRATRRAVELAFGGKLEDHFESFEERPLASGSVAQVHRAVLKLREGGPRAAVAAAGGAGGPRVAGLLPVAVKVRHPRVAARIATDFRLLKPLAAAASRVRGLRGFSLQQSLAQFSATMTAQADLRVEAAHLRRMGRNFAAVRDSVTLPAPVAGYDGAEGVLVESFERGESVAAYMRKSAPGAASFNPQIVALGVDAYLKMLLHDNFVVRGVFFLGLEVF